MADLEELAGRVEALVGQDQLVDAEIHCVLNPEYSIDIREGGIIFVVKDRSDRGAFYTGAKPYTASLDAAVTLLGEHWWSMLSGKGSIAKVGRSGEWAHCANGEARTPALALTAAALRALSRTQGNPNG